MRYETKKTEITADVLRSLLSDLKIRLDCGHVASLHHASGPFVVHPGGKTECTACYLSSDYKGISESSEDYEPMDSKGYQWPASRLTSTEMAILSGLKRETGKPITLLLRESVRAFRKAI